MWASRAFEVDECGQVRADSKVLDTRTSVSRNQTTVDPADILLACWGALVMSVLLVRCCAAGGCGVLLAALALLMALVEWLCKRLNTTRPPCATLQLYLSRCHLPLFLQSSFGLDGREAILRPKYLLCKPLLCLLGEAWLPREDGHIRVYSNRAEPLLMFRLHALEEAMVLHCHSADGELPSSQSEVVQLLSEGRPRGSIMPVVWQWLRVACKAVKAIKLEPSKAMRVVLFAFGVVNFGVGHIP